jgi:hypothetical protein
MARLSLPLQKHTRAGRPFGDSNFIQITELMLSRVLVKAKSSQKEKSNN